MVTDDIVCTIAELEPDQLDQASSKAVAINPLNGPNFTALQTADTPFDLVKERLVVLTTKYWGTAGVRLTVGFLDNPSAELRARILLHMNAWGSFSNVRFVESAVNPQVRITRTPGGGHWSNLGTDILLVKQSKPTMNLANFTMNTSEAQFLRVVRHETGHTLGFPHEHKRPEVVSRIDRDKAIEYFKRTQSWDEDKIVHNVLSPLETSALIRTAQPDPGSIMCYWLPGSIMSDGIAVEGGRDINEIDAAFARMVYPPPTQWRHNDLTVAAGAPLAMGRPSAHTDSTQHIVFRSADGHVHELSFDGVWNHAAVTEATGAPTADSDPVGYTWAFDRTQHIVYRGKDSHIHELWFDGTWHHADLTAATNAPAAVGQPAVYAWEVDGAQHIVYRGADDHVHELVYNGEWHANDLTLAAGAPNAAGDPAGYTWDVDNTQHVVYRGPDGHIHELCFDGTWHAEDLTVAASAPNAASDPHGYTWGVDHTQHVVFRNGDGHVSELWFNGAWRHKAISAVAGAPTAAGNAHGYTWPVDRTQHVVYRTESGKIRELMFRGTWASGDLTAATSAPLAASDPFGYTWHVDRTQHVIYRSQDGHIQELWFS